MTAIWAWLLGPIGRYLLAGVAGIAIGTSAYFYVHHAGYAEGQADAKADYDKQAKADAARHDKDLANANKQYLFDVSEALEYQRSHTEPVFLCKRSTVPAAPPASADPRTAPVSLQPVPERDPGLRPGPAGPDIRGLLNDLGTASEAVSARLREQQNVP